MSSGDKIIIDGVNQLISSLMDHLSVKLEEKKNITISSNELRELIGLQVSSSIVKNQQYSVPGHLTQAPSGTRKSQSKSTTTSELKVPLTESGGCGRLKKSTRNGGGNQACGKGNPNEYGYCSACMQLVGVKNLFKEHGVSWDETYENMSKAKNVGKNTTKEKINPINANKLPEEEEASMNLISFNPEKSLCTIEGTNYVVKHDVKTQITILIGTLNNKNEIEEFNDKEKRELKKLYPEFIFVSDDDFEKIISDEYDENLELIE